MLTWAEIALAVLKLANAIMGYLDRDAMIKAGYDKAIAEAAQEIMRKTSVGKAKLDLVEKMTDAEVDDALRNLEPR